MSTKNLSYLVAGIGIGIFLYWCWMRQQLVNLALANHDQRLRALEYDKEQRAIADNQQQSKKKNGWLIAAAAVPVLKLLAIIFSQIKF